MSGGMPDNGEPDVSESTHPARSRVGLDLEALTDVFAAFARWVCSDDDFVAEDVLRHLSISAMRILHADGAGVMLVEDGRVRFVHATSPGTDDVEKLQELLQNGPCRDACGSGEVVVEADLSVALARWPVFAARATQLRLRSVAAIPLHARGRVHAVLDVYRSAPGGFTSDELRTAHAIADLATSYLVLADDRDTARRAQELLAYQAMHDQLTGLPNRTLLLDRLTHSLAAARRHERALAVVFLDLDDFKRVNDEYGHAVGDAFLAQVARRLKAVLRGEDTLARLGGDEFVLVCEDLPDSVETPTERAVEAITQRIHSALTEPVQAEGVTLRIRTSIGVAVCHPADEDVALDPTSLLRAADAEMYRHKNAAAL